MTKQKTQQMLKEEFFKELKEKIQTYFVKGGSHAFDHTERVLKLALMLAKKEAKKADLDVLKAAVLLHDISRLAEDKKEIECHAEHGAKIAEKILREMGFPEEKIHKVTGAIKVHRHSKGLKADSIEAEILQDADRLDALGAITIARMFSTGGELSRPLYKPEVPIDNSLDYKINNTSTIHGIYSKILKITPESFNTKEAKKIAKERYKFVEIYVDRFLKEWRGEL